MIEDKSVVGRRTMLSVFPHLAVTPEDTLFQVYREFRPLRNIVELTVFVKEPNKEKQRIDAEFDPVHLDDDLTPEMVRITHWGYAKSVNNCFAGEKR